MDAHVQYVHAHGCPECNDPVTKEGYMLKLGLVLYGELLAPVLVHRGVKGK